VLEDSIEALVRAAFEELKQIEDAHPGPEATPGFSASPSEGVPASPSDESDFAGQPPPNVVSWADIEAFAETAADIGPQVRAELARYHLPRPEPGPLITPMPTPKWPGRVMVALGVAAFVALGAFRLMHGLARSIDRPPPTVPRAAATAPPITSHRSAARPAWKLGLTASLRITSRCWLQAGADGREIRQETLPAGRVVTFHAKKRLELILGNAGGVTLRVNGKLIPTGRPGQVVRLVFTWRHGRVIPA
jgi:hypothetical protein